MGDAASVTGIAPLVARPRLMADPARPPPMMTASVSLMSFSS